MHIHNNSVLHYLHNIAVALLFIPRPEHSRPRPKAQGQGQGILRSRPRSRNLALRPRPRPRINIPVLCSITASLGTKVVGNWKHVVKAIWQKDHIAAAHGQFSRIRQVTPICTPCNACFLGPTGVHNQNGISIGSAVFAQLKAECRRACPGIPSPSKSPHPKGNLDHIFTFFHPSPQPKRHLKRFSRFCRAHDCHRLTDRQTTLLGR